MGLIEIIIIILLISWAFGGLLVLPASGGLFNLLIAIVIAWVIIQVINSRRID